jgi:hypothetical protein
MVKEQKEIKNALPMKEIKSDLLKTFIFAAFAVVFLLMLHFGNVTINGVVDIVRKLLRI